MGPAAWGTMIIVAIVVGLFFPSKKKSQASEESYDPHFYD